jgi:hypothetical protein
MRTFSNCTASWRAEVMDQGEAGKYRMIAVRVGNYLPPPPDAVSGLMFELLEWWNGASGESCRRC